MNLSSRATGTNCVTKTNGSIDDIEELADG
jgi:hypothetical protein